MVLSMASISEFEKKTRSSSFQYYSAISTRLRSIIIKQTVFAAPFTSFFYVLRKIYLKISIY